MVDFSDNTIVEIGPSSTNFELHQSFECPPDKSVTHRSFIFSSIASGKSQIINPLLGEDCLATKETFAQLGTRFDLSQSSEGIINIDSPGVTGWNLSQEYTFDFGNSGTTARLLLGLFSGVSGLKCNCSGDDSLSQRPMKRVTDYLTKMGAQFSGPHGSEFLPMSIEGQTLHCGSFEYNKASAQVKSSLLFAAFFADGEQHITLPSGGRDHTEKFLYALGSDITVVQNEGLEKITLHCPAKIPARDYYVPGDPSSAAFIIALHFFSGRKKGSIRNVMLNKTRTGFLSALEKMGMEVRTEIVEDKRCIEKMAHVHFTFPESWRRCEVQPQDVAPMIDEIPILALMCSYIPGDHQFSGLHELKVKESDRLAATEELISISGGSCNVNGDTLGVRGESRKTKQFSMNGKGDHRIAMSACAMALAGDAVSQVHGIRCIDVSFPNFFDVLDTFR